jgi:Family of unknown function (DUF5709)
MPQIDPEAEGIPAIEDNPPGIDGDNDIEGMFPPGDSPVGVDEWGTTAREERLDEPLADRVRREQPDVEPGDPGDLGRIVEPDQGMIDFDTEERVIGTMTADDGGMTAEESAMHITDTP